MTEAESEVRRILAEFAQLPVDARLIDGDVDLFEIGMTSHASVDVMLALEEAFDVEFPDELLRKSTFESVNAIRGALEGLGAPAASG